MTKEIEIAVISVETIKPASPIDNDEPFKISLLDQFIPPLYSPLVLFYDKIDARSQIATQLKASISKTLTSYYPLAGRLKNNLIIHNYHEGIPFIETRVNGRLDHFLEPPQLEMLDQFLPCQAFSYLQDPLSLPLMAVQLNIFDCDGIVLGLCFSHKIMDAATTLLFLRTWTAINATGSCPESLMNPNLYLGSSVFPPLQAFPPLPNRMSDNNSRFLVKRFVFDAKAVDALKAKAKGELVENPTKCETLSAFIFKSAMAASMSISGSSKPAIFTQSVNIRPLIADPETSNNAVGNLFCQSTARFQAAEPGQTDLHGLVAFARKCVKKINTEYLSRVSESTLEAAGQMVETLKEYGKIYNFSDLRRFRFHDLDFGWGKPVWVGLCGQAQHCNFTFFMSGKNDDAVEAWVILEDEIMKKLEKDPEFLAFASPNPSVICK